MEPTKELIQFDGLRFGFLKVHALQTVNVTVFEAVILVYNIEKRNKAPELNIAFSIRLRLLRHETQSILANRVKFQMRYV